MKHLLMLLCLVATCLGVAPAHAQDEKLTEEERIEDQAMNALWWGDFDELERQHTLYQQPGQRTASGRSKLVLFRDGLDRVFDGPKRASDTFFVQMEALTLQWAQAHPASPLAHVLHAAALSQHGWSYRGNGLSNTVTPDARREFDRYIAKAIDYLKANQVVAMQSSSGHLQLLNLGRAAGWQTVAMWPVAQAGMALNADDESLYKSMLTSVLPKWGGGVLQVDRVIGDIAKATAAMHGDIFYSRMYAWAADEQFAHKLFIDSAASWPRMKAGYQQLVDRHPAAVNFNTFARFACLARDKPTLLDLLERAGPKPVLGAWGSNASRTYETCKRWASEQ
jgi:hypothetical protein